MNINKIKGLPKYFENTLLLFFIIVGINFLFRLVFFTKGGIWYDEAFTIFHSQKGFNDIDKVALWDANPPFFLYLMKIWTKFIGISEFSVRFLCLLFISLTSGIVYLLTKKHFNNQTALFASLLFLSSDAMFFYSQEARVYSFIFMMFGISTWLFFEFLEKPKIWLMLALGIANYIIILSHYNEGIIIAFQAITLLVSFKLKPILMYIGSLGITAFFLRKWIDRILELFTSGGNKIVEVPKLMDIPKVFIKLYNNSPILTFLFLGILAIGLILIFSKNKLEKPLKMKVLYLFLWAIFSHIIIFLVSYKAPMYADRYLMFSVIGMYILVAFFISLSFKNNILKTSIIIICFLVGLLNINYKVDKHMDYKNAVPFIKELKTKNTLVILQTTDLSALFSYYYDQKIFKEYYNVNSNLFNDNVLTLNDATKLSDFDFSPYDKLILVQTFENYTDPENGVYTLLNRKFEYNEGIKKYEGVKIFIFNNKNYNPLVDIQKLKNKAKIALNITKIKSDKSWLESVMKKAEERKIPLDSMLYLDAIWMIEQEKGK